VLPAGHVRKQWEPARHPGVPGFRRARRRQQGPDLGCACHSVQGATATLAFAAKAAFWNL
jgi:hypothetical protein